MTYGDEFQLAVTRGDEVLDLAGDFPKFVPEPVYKRDDVTAYANVQLETDDFDVVVESKNVTRMKIWLPSSLAEKKQIKVEMNGEATTAEVQRLDAKTYLQKIADSVSSSVRYAFVELESK